MVEESKNFSAAQQQPSGSSNQPEDNQDAQSRHQYQALSEKDTYMEGLSERSYPSSPSQSSNYRSQQQFQENSSLQQQHQYQQQQQQQQAYQSSSKQHRSSELPQIPNVQNLKPGARGRNFESFTGLMTDSQQKVLVKIYKRQPLAKIDEAENQRAVYAVSDHPNVIKCLDSNNIIYRSIQQTYFVFPAFSCDLFVLLSQTGRLQEHIARYYFKQLVEALEHIHSLEFSHRNLKPKNVYIDPDCDFDIKISDFVFACNLLENSKTFVGTIDYMSPEIQLKMQHQPGKADVFALGVILFNMVTGQAPFQKATYEDKNYLLLVQSDTRPFWQQVQGTLDQNQNGLSQSFKSLIEFALRLEPTERPIASQFKFSAWMREEMATKEEVLEEMGERFKKLFPQQFGRQQSGATSGENSPQKWTNGGNNTSSMR